MESGKLSPPRNCSKDAQPVPKAVHDKHNCLYACGLSHHSQARYDLTTMICKGKQV